MRARHASAYRSRRHQHCEERAGERLEDPAVGAEIGAILAGARPQGAEPDRGGHDADAGDRPDCDQPPPRLSHDQRGEHEQERPHEIELLLDGERPHVLRAGSATPSLAK